MQIFLYYETQTFLINAITQSTIYPGVDPGVRTRRWVKANSGVDTYKSNFGYRPSHTITLYYNNVGARCTYSLRINAFVYVCVSVLILQYKSYPLVYARRNKW